MTTNHDDFWGSHADWPEVSGERREPRAGVGATVSRWWSNVVGGGSTAHREHGESRPVAKAPADAEDAPIPANSTGEIPTTRTAGRPSPRAHASGAGVEAATEEDGSDTWDSDWEVAPVAPPKPGVDPLLARIGGAAIVLTLLVPVFLGLDSGGDEPAADAAQAQSPITLVAPVAATDPAVTAPVATAPPTAASPAPDTTDAIASTTPSSAPATTRATSVGSAAPATAADVPASTSGTAITTTARASSSAERVEQNCAIDYTVAAGDFWIRLADAAGVPLEQLLEVNDATSDTALYPGRTICLPVGAAMPSAPTTAAPAIVTAPTTTARPVSATTVPPTIPATSPTTVAPVVTYPTPSAAVVQQIIRDIWPDDLEARAIEIADRESNFVATARNSCCYGVFQLYFSAHRSWLDDLGVTSAEQLFDVKTNVLAAYVLYQRSGGWGPWT